MNKVILIGNLTRDPEQSVTPTGVSVCKMSIAVGRKFANASGERETDFFNITAWRALADNCAMYLNKGKKICITGSIQMRSYDDKDGVKRTVTEVIAEDVEFLSPSNSEAAESPVAVQKATQGAKKKTVSELTPMESENLPF